MKRVILGIVLILLCAFLAFRLIRAKVGHDISQPVYQPALPPTPTVAIDPLYHTDTALFVPDWTLDSVTGNYDQFIYFGVSPTKEGLATSDSVNKGITTFLASVPPGKQTFLTLEMVSTDVNGVILQSKLLQQKIATQTISLAKTNGFSGIVLDLEMSGIPLGSTSDEINGFTKQLYTMANAQHLQFEVTLYGDTFYRLRPFDVKQIAKNSDMVMIMAYDFHKARSDPGPNFPLHGKNTYGYDMTQMAADFLQAVPNQKLSVVFGMFGYDWPVDNQGNAIGQAQALTDSQIQHKFLNGCAFAVCQIKRDPVSAETVIHYTDDTGQKHIVWFDDRQSVSQKEKFLRKQGIGNFAFWANSYF